MVSFSVKMLDSIGNLRSLQVSKWNNLNYRDDKKQTLVSFNTFIKIYNDITLYNVEFISISSQFNT